MTASGSAGKREATKTASILALLFGLALPTGLVARQGFGTMAELVAGPG